MKTDRPSSTALRVALARAAHQVVDAEPRILADPVALQIVGAAQAEALRGAPRRYSRMFARRMRAFVLARSRIAEDELAAAVARGVRQYVVLGAGLDTFACRNPWKGELRVFEVDHPATQGWKRRLLAEAGLPGAADFVPVDFERQSWLEALRCAGFRPDLPAHVAWLGVAMYLSRRDVEQVLATLGGFAPGSSVVLDYLVPRSELDRPHRLVLAVLSLLVTLVSEPIKSHFSAAQMRALLQAHGFAQIADLGREELNARFFGGRGDGLEVGALGRIVSARN